MEDTVSFLDCLTLGCSWSCLEADYQTSKPSATSARLCWRLIPPWHSTVPALSLPLCYMGLGEARDLPYEILRSHVRLDCEGKGLGLKLSSWSLWGHPLTCACNTKLYVFLYLRMFCLSKGQSSLAVRTLLSYVKNGSSSPYFKSGPSKDPKLNFLDTTCYSMQYTILYTHWHLYIWFLGCSKSYIQLKDTSSTVKVWVYADMVEIPLSCIENPIFGAVS